ncbi:MAG: MiaB/RimO family radical SAM methylthiotransferase [candidate division WOR-3 bacterium]
MKFFIKSFGCRLNQYYADYFANSVVESGFEIVKEEREADVVAIASCVVTHRAERDLRHYVSHIKRLVPKAKIVVFGCYPKYGKEVDADVAGELREILKVLNLKDPGHLVRPFLRVRENVRVQEGCNFRCSYCVVPFVRGPSRSRPEDEILKEIESLYASGVVEIVLTGIQTGAWGREWGDRLSNLILRIKDHFPELRLRLSSISPIHIDEGVIELLKAKIVLPHLHLPMQHGSEKVLKEMKRPYKLSYYVNLVEKLVSNVPEIAIGSDIIVGFPTETDEDFEESIRLIEELPFAYLHVFEFSRREKTEAYFMKPLPSAVVRRRKNILLPIARRKKLGFLRKNLGKEIFCVIEREEDGFFEATTDNYIKVKIRSDNLKIGEVRRIKLISINEDNATMVGEVVEG